MHVCVSNLSSPATPPLLCSDVRCFHLFDHDIHLSFVMGKGGHLFLKRHKWPLPINK